MRPEALELSYLEGKTVTDMKVSKNRQCVMLNLDDDENLYLTAVGDCCSESWFEHIQDKSEIIGMKILKIEQVNLGRVTPTKQESDELYCIKFTTNNKWEDLWMLEFRNSSNGYYGGSVTLSILPLNEYNDPYEGKELQELMDWEL